jgi:hypothetical protein
MRRTEYFTRIEISFICKANFLAVRKNCSSRERGKPPVTLPQTNLLLFSVDIRLFTNSPKLKIELADDEIVVHATEEPEKGKVNKEILKQLTKLFQRQVEIISGATSK